MMRTDNRSLPFAFIVWIVPTMAAAGATEAARTFVQATILGSNPAAATLTFLDASGRQRVARAAGDALSSLAVVRRGDQAILSLSTDGGAPVVTKVRVRRAEPRPAETAAAAPMPGGSLPLKRSWPNPYAKASRDARGAPAN
jgi:hypothetical protein